MKVDGLTKAFTMAKHQEFVKMARLEDIQGCFDREKRLEALKDQIKASRDPDQMLVVIRRTQRGWALACQETTGP